MCLTREGVDKDPGALGRWTIGEILSIRSFGPRCLVDLLSSLETLLGRGGQLSAELTDEARRLAAMPEAAAASADDPRFGPLIREVNVEARSAKQLAEQLLSRSQDGPDPRFAAAEVRRLRERIEGLSKCKLEEELIQVFASTENQRNRDILIGYYGWKDGRRHTLAEIGARYDMTRERTRQICAKLIRRRASGPILAPVVDRGVGVGGGAASGSGRAARRLLVEAELTAVGMSMEGVAVAAKLLGREPPFRIVRVEGGRLGGSARSGRYPSVAVEAAKKEVYYHGLATVKQVEAVLGGRFSGRVGTELMVQIVQMIEGFHWLDRKTGWFRLAAINKHGLPRAIEKIFAVAGPIRARISARPSAAIAACGRCRRRRACSWSSAGRARAEGRGRRDLRRAVRGLEEGADRRGKGTGEHPQGARPGAGTRRDRGPLRRPGMNRFSFHAFIASSGVIAQYGHSVYGLLGADVSAKTVQSSSRRGRANRMPARVLDSHGTTEDGRLWLSYRLSKAASTYAVITVPSTLKDVVRGKYQLLTPDGSVVGTLAAKDGRAWGLGAFLRRQGAQVDDHVVITLDLERRTAVIAMNGVVPVDGGR